MKGLDSLIQSMDEKNDRSPSDGDPVDKDTDEVTTADDEDAEEGGESPPKK
jgi:hypothetical protein